MDESNNVTGHKRTNGFGMLNVDDGKGNRMFASSDEGNSRTIGFETTTWHLQAPELSTAEGVVNPNKLVFNNEPEELQSKTSRHQRKETMGFKALLRR